MPADEVRGKAADMTGGLRLPSERCSYARPASSRAMGLASTCAIFALVLASFFLTIRTTSTQKVAPATLTVLDIREPAAPPETPPADEEAPAVEKLPDPAPDEPIEPIIEPDKVPVSPARAQAPAVAPRLADPAPRVPEAAAPKAATAPPAPQVANKGPETWEGRVLAALNQRRRYPRLAMARREQGVPWVRFVMDRDGKVLSARLERPSGFPDLDREAVVLPKRAQPLPKPPAERPGDRLELVVPVEFFLR